jgi:hypothetical protein
MRMKDYLLVILTAVMCVIISTSCQGLKVNFGDEAFEVWEDESQDGMVVMNKGKFKEITTTIESLQKELDDCNAALGKEARIKFNLEDFLLAVFDHATEEGLVVMKREKYLELKATLKRLQEELADCQKSVDKKTRRRK